MPRKILCPIDFAPPAEDALRVAARIAVDWHAALEIVHVWHVPALAAGDLPLPAEAMKALADEEGLGLADAVAEARGVGVAEVTARVLQGSPWERIVDAARRDRDCELVVLGTHGRKGFARWMLGSVADKVVRHAPCSVLVARARGGAGQFRHVLCPVDFSDRSRFAFEQAVAIAAPDGIGVQLVHVIDPPRTHHHGVPPMSDVLYDLDKRATLQLEDWAAAARQGVVTCDVRVGDPAREVLAALEEDATIDLVVVGTRGRTAIERVVLGSVAEKLARHASCAVLVARRRA
jgi:nucleotide-binding universal stress UspA family protein